MIASKGFKLAHLKETRGLYNVNILVFTLKALTKITSLEEALQ